MISSAELQDKRNYLTDFGNKLSYLGLLPSNTGEKKKIFACRGYCNIQATPHVHKNMILFWSSF